MGKKYLNGKKSVWNQKNGEKVKYLNYYAFFDAESEREVAFAIILLINPINSPGGV